MSTEHERCLLGAILNDAAVLDGERVDAELFEKPEHQQIFSTMHDLHSSGQPVTLLTVADRLGDKLSELGGSSYLASLTDMPTAANADYYIGSLEESVRRRSLRTLSREVEEQIERGRKVEEILSLIEDRTVRLRHKGGQVVTVEPSTAFRQIREKLLKRMEEHSAGPTGVATGFQTLDALTGGFQPSDLILVGARTSIGKTSLILSWIDDQLSKGIRVSLASLEMSAVQVWERLLSMRSLVHTGRLRFGYLRNEEFESICAAMDDMEDAAMRIIDKPELNIRSLRAWAHTEVGKGSRILYVDYAGLLAAENDRAPRWEQMSTVSRGLKGLAHELQIPVVCLVQLNRDAAASQEPGLHNIRDSGAFEQDADLVMMLTREGEESLEDSVSAQLLMRKHRNGPTGLVKLQFRKSLTQFREADGAADAA
jgi:replicative DNA helicase